MITLTPFQDALPSPDVIDLKKNGKTKETIKIKNGKAKLHMDLPETDIWGYNGTYPGPTIEVEQNKEITIEWKNLLNNSSYPAAVVVGTSGTQAEYGGGGRLPLDTSKLPNAVAAHLHGASTNPDHDGWTDNVLLKNQSANGVYDNNDDATLFWYHDHAMGITRYNVYSGLAGLYIIRSKIERDLGLPSGKYEIPLLIQDKNLETDVNGEFTGRILHKVVDDTMEFFGPLTLVNGKIWPFKEVERAVYRFRVINGSNARTYHLKLIDENNNAYTSSIMYQIGSDGGFFKEPVLLTNNELILAPAERADIIVDFRIANIKGKKLTWVNIGRAPFNGKPIDFPSDPYNITDDQIISSVLQKNIAVIQFKVANTNSVTDNYHLTTFKTDFKRLTHKLKSGDLASDFIVLPPTHSHRYLALVEEPSYVENQTHGFTEVPMLMLRELEPIDNATYKSLKHNGEFSIKLTEGTDVKFFKSVASMFYDPITFFIRYGTWEVWKILNLTHDTHPFHIHLVQFQAINLQTYKENIDEASETEVNNRVGAMNFEISIKEDSPDLKHLDENEKGWKDTIRINPNQMISIAMQFKGHCGRYMFHCHLLEHEDREMMRPFVVLPDYIIDNMQMGNNNTQSHHH